MIYRFETTASTMLDAAVLAARGEPHGTVVVAERQTAGIGRHGHSWNSESDRGLYFSIILRLPLPAEALPILTMALGLAVQSAIHETCHVACDLRWPNDVMLSEKKVAGILVQTAEGTALIAGIGINVNQQSFPEELAATATSLRLETGLDYSKDMLLDRVIAQALHYSQILVERGKAEILRRFEEQSSYVRGKAVEVEGKLRGVTSGLDANGFLLVSTASGTETIFAGGVRAIDN